MDLSEQTVQGDLALLKSPVRVLARFFRKSRDNWKGKYQRDANSTTPSHSTAINVTPE